MEFIIAIAIVATSINHAFHGTNPLAFLGDIILVGFVAGALGGG